MKGKIFNAQEVQAIIAGNKTMFREVIKIQPTNKNQVFSTVASSIRNKDIGTHNFINPKATWEQTKKFKCPYHVGKKIFVKESFVNFRSNNSDIFYKSDFEINNLVKTADLKWKPAQHMKQEHSRITLEITDVKVERLQSISQEDCAKEGIAFGMWQANGRFFSAPGEPIEIGFAKNWNATHKKPEEKFEANPFVWVVDFEVVK